MTKKIVHPSSTATAHHKDTAMPSTTTKTAHHAASRAAHPRTTHQEKTAMHTKSHPHHATTTTHAKEVSAMTSSLEEASISPAAQPPVAAVAAQSTASGGAAAPPTSPVPSVASPPTNTNIPSPPTNFARATAGEFRIDAPRKSELAAMPQALIDLSNFTSFDTLFAAVGLTQATVAQCLLVGSQWSSLRAATSQWDTYCVLQEGYAWRAIRAVLLRLQQAFLLAAQANPPLVAMYPGLASLLDAKKTIAKKAASTRRLNLQAKANGEPQTHGIVGKQRQRRAEKAALASGASAAPVTSTPPASPVTTQTPGPIAVPASPAAVPPANSATH